VSGKGGGMKQAILALGMAVIALVVFLLSAQITFGDTLPQETVAEYTNIISENPVIPFIKHKRSKSTVSEIANFSYELPEKGEITSASIGFRWGGRNFNQISHLDLYLDNILVLDFSEYYRDLSRAEKKTLKRTLSHRGMIDFSLHLTEADLAALEDGKTSFTLVGKPKYFRSLQMAEVTLNIIGDYFFYNLSPKLKLFFSSGDYSDKNVITTTKFVPTPDPDPSTDPFTNHDPSTIPEPSTMLLIGSGLLGAGLYRRFRKPRG